MKFGNYSLSLPALSDSDDILDLIERNRERIVDYFPVTATAIKDKASAKIFIKEKMAEAENKHLFCFLIRDSKKGKPAGMVFIKNIDWRIPKAELAYYVDAAYEGKGIATKAVNKLVEYCYSEFRMNKLFLRIAKDNEGSQRVAEKNGFIIEGTLRSDFKKPNGKLIDLYYYGLVRE